MTQAANSPWEPFTRAEIQEMARRVDVMERHDNHVPARSAAERTEYDQIDLDAAQAAEARERDHHFYGFHVQDPYVPHEDCAYSCPYDTPEQAQARERQEATRAAELEAKAKDERYDEYAADCGYGMQEGNPPDSRRLDEEIQRLSEEYPEITYPEQMQTEYDAEVRERGPNLYYPEYEGPGYTEPPCDWEGWHQDHDPGWTFDQWAEEHGYSRAQIDGTNEEFAWGWSYPAPNTFINGEWHEGLEPPKVPEADQAQRMP